MYSWLTKGNEFRKPCFVVAKKEKVLLYWMAKIVGVDMGGAYFIWVFAAKGPSDGEILEEDAAGQAPPC